MAKRVKGRSAVRGNSSKGSGGEKEGYFIISSLNGEIYVNHMFENKAQAEIWAKEACLNKKLFRIERARVRFKDK